MQTKKMGKYNPGKMYLHNIKYSIIRVLPKIETGQFLNIGVAAWSTDFNCSAFYFPACNRNYKIVSCLFPNDLYQVEFKNFLREAVLFCDREIPKWSDDFDFDGFINLMTDRELTFSRAVATKYESPYNRRAGVEWCCRDMYTKLCPAMRNSELDHIKIVNKNYLERKKIRKKKTFKFCLY